MAVGRAGPDLKHANRRGDASELLERNARYMLTASAYAPALRSMVWMLIRSIDQRVLEGDCTSVRS